MESEQKTFSPLSPKRWVIDVLIVDDNPINQVFFSTAIKKGGYTAITVNNGKAAIQQATYTRFRLVLMDIRMPGMDGYQTVRHLRNIAGPNQSTPVVATSAESLQEADAHLFDDFLIKPVSKKQLLNMVARHVQSKPHEEPSTPTSATAAVSPPAMVIDPQRSLAAAGQDPHIARRLQAMLRDELPGQLQQLRDLHEAKDTLALRELVHRMTGSASFCGATALCQCLRNYGAILKDSLSSSQDCHKALQNVENAVWAVLRHLEEDDRQN